MKFNVGLHLRQELKLHPQLILTLKLLPLTAVELEGLVRQEMEENPVLEEHSDATLAEETPVTTDGSLLDTEGPGELVGEADSAPDELGETTKYLDLIPDDGFFSATARVPSGGQDEVDAIDLAVASGPNICEALMPELRAELSEDDAAIAEVVLESLDEDGLLTVSEEDLAEANGFDLGRLRAVLYRIHRIEPGGIACRDQQQALLIQLEMHGHSTDDLEYRLVAECWHELLHMQITKVARTCRASVEDVRQAAERVLCLEPRPGRRFSQKRIEYVSPDFTIVWRDGRPLADYNDDRIPRLRLSRRYVEVLKNPKMYSKEQVEFARQKMNRAVMFLRAIESRRQTLQKLMKVILEQQHGFFEHGPEHLKPATLKDAANEIGVHPSTISRASSGKYVETSYGIFPLKYFFKAGAGDKSRASIKELIRQILDEEDKSSPLTDDQIGEKLKEQGVAISRRTVAKYRGELGIPGRNQRGKL